MTNLLLYTINNGSVATASGGLKSRKIYPLKMNTADGALAPGLSSKKKRKQRKVTS